MKACPHCNAVNGHHKFNCPEKQLESIVVMGPSTPPTTEEAELWRELMSTIGFESKTDRSMAMVNGIIWDRMKTYSLSRRSEQNSEAIEFDPLEEEDPYSAVGKARKEHELREFLSEVALERADFVKLITKFFPHERSPADPKERNMYLNIRVAAENILILYDQMVERLKQKQ